MKGVLKLLPVIVVVSIIVALIARLGDFWKIVASLILGSTILSAATYLNKKNNKKNGA